MRGHHGFGLPVERDFGYSQAIRADGWVWIAGQVGRDPEVAGIEGRSAEVRGFLERALAAAGLRWEDVVYLQSHVVGLARDRERALGEHRRAFAHPTAACTVVESAPSTATTTSSRCRPSRPTPRP